MESWFWVAVLVIQAIIFGVIFRKAGYSGWLGLTDSLWELYDVSSDRSESKNQAKEKPEKVKELATIWANQFEEFTALARKDLPK